MELLPNKGKNLIIEVADPSASSGLRKWARYPVKTKLITSEDKDIALVARDYAKKYLEPEDIVFISEKAVAITQGRSYPIKEIKASRLAKFLSGFVTKTPIGIGLGSPETMQLAIEEVGVARMLLAAFIGVAGKVLGIKGLFYIIAGDGARSIDGAVEYAIPPYNTYVSKGPVNPNEVAKKVSEMIGAKVAIVDANDFGVNILGSMPGLDRKLVAKALKDNPLGQADECTPIGILREIKW
ncbi:MAG: coenzyme F420-0:L-glutamate ligase [Patescibacteria group bacterium]